MTKSKTESKSSKPSAPARKSGKTTGSKAASGTEVVDLAPEAVELLYQTLETELGGVQIYTQALECAQNDDLREEWEEYLEQTEHHVEVVQDLFQELGLDPEHEVPGRQCVRAIGEALVRSMKLAKQKGSPGAAELAAAEAVVLAETKDHLNWSLLAKLAETLDGPAADAVSAAVEEVEDEEDEHLYHSQGWTRELWFDALGLPAKLPPPEEVDDVQTAEEAAKAQKKAKSRRG
jgi:rubrerythrin